MIISSSSIFCSFAKIAPNTYQCMKCENIVTADDNIDEPPLVPCISPVSRNYNPTNVHQFMSEHIESAELCSESEIDNRHKICESCEFFKDNSCTQCGCLLSKDRIYLNKLAMKSQSCPINKW